MTNKVVTLEPVSRLEGKARIRFEINEKKKSLSKAEFNVLEFRAFEKFMEGRMARELPRITPRICGICPVSHHLASAKATDMLARTIIPRRAVLHRELMHMAQTVHSHVLHIYFLALPDFVDGFKNESNDFRLLLAKHPDIVNKVIKIRAFAQKIIQIIGGKAIHPVTAIPGGISKALSNTDHKNLLEEAKKLLPKTKEVLETAWALLDAVPEELTFFETLDTHNLSMIGPNKEISLYDGEMIISDWEGVKKGQFFAAGYEKLIEERHHSTSWTKFPHFSAEKDPEKGILQVGPLARQKTYESIPTEYAAEMLDAFRKQFGQYTKRIWATHHARILETMYAMENIIKILENPELMADTPYRVKTPIVRAMGVGIIEAPRGTVLHAYESNDMGKITRTNIIVATTFNNPAINLALFKVAQNTLTPDVLKKGISDETLRYIESSVRVFDPCLTCSSHGANNFRITVENTKGKIIQKVTEFSRKY